MSAYHRGLTGQVTRRPEAAALAEGRYNPRMRTIPVSEFRRWLADTQSAGPITLLVGSAVSGFLPTGLPTGQAVTNALADMLSADVGPTRDLVHKLIGESAFEHVMEACPQQNEVRQVVAGLYDKDTENDCHKAVARLVGTGAVRHVITTNYDRCFETAFRGLNIRRVVGPADIGGWRPDVPTYFKIHGCASDPDTVVLTLTGEPALVGWKHDLLTSMVQGHRVVVIGYSGRDFEICPELVRLKPTLAWSSFEPPSARRPYHPSPGAIAVLKLDASTVVEGDMCDALAAMGTVRPTVTRPGLSQLPPQTFMFGASPAEIARNTDLWRCQLFRGIGCARAATVAAKRLMASAAIDADRATAHHYLGLADFHAGKYPRAASAYRAAAALSGQPQKNGYLFDAVIADRCVGYNKRALATLAVLSQESPSYRPQLLLRQLEFWASEYETARAAGHTAGAGRVQALALPFARELAASSHLPGSRLEHQQSDLLARRLEISDQVERVPYAPAPSREGFSQFGYAVAVAMAVRQNLLDGKDLPDADEARTMFEELDDMGAAAEAWKFGLALYARYRKEIGDRILVRVVRNFVRCQYTAKQRQELVVQILGRLRSL
jgi:tetratricopeptide (TPR) repeat protein